MAAQPVDAVDVLREHLRRYPADRQPLQHATAQFHLGGALLQQGGLDEAEACYSIAAAVFAARGARAEQAKALNGLGATLRAADRLDLAVRALQHAAAGLAEAGLSLEEGAARCNLGVVLRESGHPRAAADALERARALLDPAKVPAQAATAARELGTTRLELGELAAAQATLTEAIDLADRSGDQAGLGAAANALGLSWLADGRPVEAAEAFRTATQANPRGIRPREFAMAKANLGYAYERAHEPARARLAARQALSPPGVPAPVRAQAAGVLKRLGANSSDLRAVLEADSPEARPSLVREELTRSADADAAGRAIDMRAWIEAITASALDPADVAELWLGGLLELPPDRLEALASAAVVACDGIDAEVCESFREAVVRGMVRFHVPQWMRLQDTFSQAADAVGDPGPWR